MCGRYYIDLSLDALLRICEEVQRRQSQLQGCEQLQIKFSGEVFPTDIVPVQTGMGSYQPMRWGFVGPNKRPVINARSETALEKPMFHTSMAKRRCLVPAAGYYEWKQAGGRKIKHRLFISSQPLFFAGCYRLEQGEAVPRFVILTQKAAPAITGIHDRMPVIIAPQHAERWLCQGPALEGMRPIVPSCELYAGADEQPSLGF